MPMFKNKRKHRSLSQRKHTIGKMGPKHEGTEDSWTEEEDKKLCALGDAGKTLWEIHRKFSSRNGQRCLDRYFSLKGYPTASRSHIRASHQARRYPEWYPLSTQHTHSSSIRARHHGYDLHRTTPFVNPISNRQNSGTILQRSYHAAPTSSQNNFASCPTVPTFLNNLSSPKALGNASTNWRSPSRYQTPATSSSSFSASTAGSPLELLTAYPRS